MAVSTQRAIATIRDEIRGSAESALPLAGTGEAAPASLDAAARELVWMLRGELALHLGESPTPRHRKRKLTHEMAPLPLMGMPNPRGPV